MSKHDNVIGYIEYLDSGGCVRERIPYFDAEEFKTRIYASLYCGEPIIPVVFPEKPPALSTLLVLCHPGRWKYPYCR